MAIGKNVERLRKRRELTLEVVASAVGTDPQAISQMEKRDSKTSTFAVKLARFFGVDLADLMSEDFDADLEPQQRTSPAYQYQWVNSEEADLLTQFRTVDDEGRKMILGLATGLPKVVSSPAIAGHQG